MAIQWFPGHMAKARRELAEKLKYVDIVYELVDARLPLSSRNPMLDQIIQQKAKIILLNKADLADPIETQHWKNYFKEKGTACLAINSQQNKGMSKIIQIAREVLAEKFIREKNRGIKPRAIRAVCIGIPNVGKSTLMNRLVGKNIARTGNTPGVTKGQQWLKSGKDLELLDTPGILWPKFEDQLIGEKLALTGAIKDTLIPMEDLALYALTFFSMYYPISLAERYKLNAIDLELSTADLLMKITKIRGFKEDYERGSEMIVREVRDGKLGPFTLDRFEEMEK